MVVLVIDKAVFIGRASKWFLEKLVFVFWVVYYYYQFVSFLRVTVFRFVFVVFSMLFIFRLVRVIFWGGIWLVGGRCSFVFFFDFIGFLGYRRDFFKVFIVWKCLTFVSVARCYFILERTSYLECESNQNKVVQFFKYIFEV